MVNIENRVAGGHQGQNKRRDLPGIVLQRAGAIVHRGAPSTAGDKDRAVPVRLYRVVDVHQQRQARVHPKNHVAVNLCDAGHRAFGRGRRLLRTNRRHNRDG